MNNQNQQNSDLKPKINGFTLVELLVVIAIIALLIAIVLPTMGTARESARATVCASNLREIGKAMLHFTGDNDDRLPGGGGSYTGPSSPLFPINPISWIEVLNESYDVGIIRTPLAYPNSGILTCPSIRKVFNTNFDKFKRAYTMNVDAAGGQVSGNWYNPGPGAYGTLSGIVPSVFQAGNYRFGASISQIDNPSSKFLVIETERHAEYVNVRTPKDTITLGDDPNFPQWSSHNGIFAFRHNLKSNFLFIDLHVERLSYTDDINSDERLTF